MFALPQRSPGSAGISIMNPLENSALAGLICIRICSQHVRTPHSVTCQLIVTHKLEITSREALLESPDPS